MPEVAAFLEMLKANPADDTVRLVFADWLDEPDEPAKAQYLRAVVDLARLPCGAPAYAGTAVQLYTACACTDPDWRQVAGARFEMVLEGFGDKVRAIKLIRELTGLGLGEAKAMAESVPVALFSWLPFEVALPHLLAFAHPNVGAIEARIRPTPWPEAAPGAVFDVLLCALHSEPNFWSHYMTGDLAQLLQVGTDEAGARLRNLPLVVSSGLHPTAVAGFVRRLKLACNVGRALPPDAIRVVPRVPAGNGG